MASESRRTDGLPPQMIHPTPNIVLMALDAYCPRNASNPRSEQRYCWMVPPAFPAI